MRHRLCKAPLETQRSFLLQRGAGPFFLTQKPFDRMHRLNPETRGDRRPWSAGYLTHGLEARTQQGQRRFVAKP